MRSVPQGSVLRPMLFNVFISDIDSGIECTLSMFVDDAKLCGVVNMSEGWVAIQRDLDGLEQQAQANLTKFNKSKCKVLHLDCENSLYQYTLTEYEAFRYIILVGSVSDSYLTERNATSYF